MPTFWQWRSRRTFEEDEMSRTIRCECGYVARGDSDEAVVMAIRAHMAADHPALLQTVEREDLLAWIQIE
jgi:predicted small metal-binding protein